MRSRSKTALAVGVAVAMTLGGVSAYVAKSRPRPSAVREIIPEEPKVDVPTGPGGSEQEILAKHGVVITEKTATSFHVGYMDLFHAHDPVYVTADAILEAWQSSYDSILANIESGALIPVLSNLLTRLRAQLGSAPGSDEAKRDVDAYLTIAASLLDGSPVAPVAGANTNDIDRIVTRATEARLPAEHGACAC